MYILMKLLESSPSRYDKWISVLSFGSLNKMYDYMVSYIRKGMEVLDIGCGTGLLTFRIVKRGARVKGIDSNPAMLEIAKRKVKDLEKSLFENIHFYEMGIGELGSEKEESFDAIVSGLCFSELGDIERDFIVKEIWRILKKDGLFLLADETLPSNGLKRFTYLLLRVFLLFLTYFLTGTTTRPLRDFPEKLRSVGFIIEEIRYNKMGNFMMIVAKKDEYK